MSTHIVFYFYTDLEGINQHGMLNTCGDAVELRHGMIVELSKRGFTDIVVITEAYTDPETWHTLTNWHHENNPAMQR